MQRQALAMLTAAFMFGAAGALAQDGDLSGVTMRVLDDISDVDAVVLALDASRAEDESADADGRGTRTEREAGAESEAADARDAETDDDRLEVPRRDELHDADDERSEGRLEDRDVERPAAPPPPG